MIRSFAFVAAWLAASLGAQTHVACGHNRVVRVKVETHYGRNLGCGEIDIAANGVRLRSRNRGCPAFITHRPGYPGTETAPGSWTNTRPVGAVATITMVYTCTQEWFLFIPIGSACAFVRQSTTASEPTYGQVPCPDGSGDGEVEPRIASSTTERGGRP